LRKVQGYNIVEGLFRARDRNFLKNRDGLPI